MLQSTEKHVQLLQEIESYMFLTRAQHSKNVYNYLEKKNAICFGL